MTPQPPPAPQEGARARVPELDLSIAKEIMENPPSLCAYIDRHLPEYQLEKASDVRRWKELEAKLYAPTNAPGEAEASLREESRAFHAMCDRLWKAAGQVDVALNGLPCDVILAKQRDAANARVAELSGQLEACEQHVKILQARLSEATAAQREGAQWPELVERLTDVQKQMRDFRYNVWEPIITDAIAALSPPAPQTKEPGTSAKNEEGKT